MIKSCLLLIIKTFTITTTVNKVVENITPFTKRLDSYFFTKPLYCIAKKDKSKTVTDNIYIFLNTQLLNIQGYVLLSPNGHKTCVKKRNKDLIFIKSAVKDTETG